MQSYISWSGEKDSTAGVILEHVHGMPKSKIILSEVMFDRKRNISGELPEHIDFVRNKAIPIFQSWGYDVKIVRAEKDYLDLFYHIVTRSKIPERNGKHQGFLLGGRCAANDRLKIKPIKDYLRSCDGEYIQYVGIAADEPERLNKLAGTNKVSLVAEHGYTEEMAFELCRRYELLSPVYDFAKRGGCWFCPNQGYAEFAHLKQNHPDLWAELKRLSQEESLISQGFKWGETFAEAENRVDRIIKAGDE